MVEFSIVDLLEAQTAFAWHREFASGNDAIYPRSEDEFRMLVEERCVWWARLDGEVLGMAYAHIDRLKGEWEIGGLMVSEAARGKSIGSVLMNLALGQSLLNEDPYARPPYPTIVSHVLKSNDSPRTIIEAAGFAFDHDMVIPADALPGLRADDDGFIRGDEFHLQIPDGVLILAKWARDWNGRLRDDTPAQLDLLDGLDLKVWSEAFEEMAAQIRDPDALSTKRRVAETPTLPEHAADKPTP